MSALTVSLHLADGAPITVVPNAGGAMIAFGKRHDAGVVCVTLTEAGVAMLLSKLTRVLMEADAPSVIDTGPVNAGDASLGFLASVRAKLVAQGAELTAPADDFGPIGESSLGSPSLSTALSQAGPGATVEQLREALGLEPLGMGAVTTADVETYLDQRRLDGGDNVVTFPRGVR